MTGTGKDIPLEKPSCSAKISPAFEKCKIKFNYQFIVI